MLLNACIHPLLSIHWLQLSFTSSVIHQFQIGQWFKITLRGVYIESITISAGESILFRALCRNHFKCSFSIFSAFLGNSKTYYWFWSITIEHTAGIFIIPVCIWNIEAKLIPSTLLWNHVSEESMHHSISPGVNSLTVEHPTQKSGLVLRSQPATVIVNGWYDHPLSLNLSHTIWAVDQETPNCRMYTTQEPSDWSGRTEIL